MNASELFHPGPLVATPGALDALIRNNRVPANYLQRHFNGDWGDICEEDKCANEEALKTGARIMSVYFLPDESILWIITDEVIDEMGHRQATTLLLPEEY